MDHNISILPEDIVRIIVGSLDPHIVTLLDKKYRDGYFKKHGLTIKYDCLSHDALDNQLLRKYKINLYLGNMDGYDSEIIYNNTTRLRVKSIDDLGYYLDKYPNLVHISGHLETTSDNLEKLRLIKNDLVLNVDSPVHLDLIKKYTNVPNLVSIIGKKYTYGTGLDGLKDRLLEASSNLLGSNTQYPNIEVIILDEHLPYYLEKNILLPRLKKIFIYYHILDADKVNIIQKYPGVLIQGR